MSPIDRSYEEKRDYIRMQVNSAITITHNSNTYAGTCIDLSGTGMMIATDAALSIDDECEVSIEQNEEGRRPFNALVKVSRIIAKDDGLTTIGFSITEVLT
ncbi:MAG: hypothetical protein ACJA0N_001292 [Pseudohongiellaceae bacterium]|jgi:hypothetical protein